MSNPPAVMATVFGKPKRKKTSDTLAAFPNGLFVGVPSSLKLVAQNELGFTPRVFDTPPQTLPELLHLLHSVSAQAQEFGAIIVDDASHICQQSMLHWEAEAPKGRSGKPDKFWPYQRLKQSLLELAGTARYLGVHFVMTFHEREGGTNAMGHFTPGGPDLPSRNQVERIPSWCDINVRSIIDPDYPDPWFKGAYYCNPQDPDWVTGDRTGVCTRTEQNAPANLREILRASNSGYMLPRIDGLEWQDDLADEIASRFVDGENVEDMLKDINKSWADKKVQPLHLRWACQDGIARGVLRMQSNRGLFDFSAPEVGGASSPSLPPPPPSDN